MYIDFWIIKVGSLMGRRRRKRVVRSRQYQIPNVFQCPSCGVKSIQIELDKESNIAFVKCGNCKINDEVLVKPLMEPVDVFGKFVDQYFVKLREAEKGEAEKEEAEKAE
jgi:transcription elongation factor Elf1